MSPATTSFSSRIKSLLQRSFILFLGEFHALLWGPGLIVSRWWLVSVPWDMSFPQTFLKVRITVSDLFNHILMCTLFSSRSNRKLRCVWAHRRCLVPHVTQLQRSLVLPATSSHLQPQPDYRRLLFCSVAWTCWYNDPNPHRHLGR